MHDDKFIAGFQAGSLESFHHQDHVKMAWLYLQRHPVLEAVAKFTADLKHFALANGQPNLYHETITWAYLFLIHERIANQPPQSWQEFAEANADLLNWQVNILKSYYREETLKSELARRVFVFPDKFSPALA